MYSQNWLNTNRIPWYLLGSPYSTCRLLPLYATYGRQPPSLYKILFHFAAFMWKKSSFYCPLPPALPALLRHYCTSIAQDTTLPRPPPLYAINHTILVMAISCKGQPAAASLMCPSQDGDLFTPATHPLL